MERWSAASKLRILICEVTRSNASPGKEESPLSTAYLAGFLEAVAINGEELIRCVVAHQKRLTAVDTLKAASEPYAS